MDKRKAHLICGVAAVVSIAAFLVLDVCRVKQVQGLRNGALYPEFSPISD